MSSPFRRSLWRSRYLVPALAVALACGVAVVGPEFGMPSLPRAVADAIAGDPTIPGTSVTVGLSDCGTGWTGGQAGPETLAIYNSTGTMSLEVVLLSDTTGEMYLDVEDLGPLATRSYKVSLPPGGYHFVCTPSDLGTFAGVSEKVTGTYGGAYTPGVPPTDGNDVIQPILGYEKWVTGRFPVVATEVSTLTVDLKAGKLAKSRSAWLTAHLTYETLGSAYDAFGDLGDAIDADPAHGVSPVTDPDLTGFHKIEALLWHGTPSASQVRKIAPYGTRLHKDVEALVPDFGGAEAIQTWDLGLRSHEILEDDLRDLLIGLQDAGSHTDLATLDANFTGSQEALTYLAPVLTTRDADFAKTKAGLVALKKLVEGYHTKAGWKPLSSLTRVQREQLDAGISNEAELLSKVALVSTPVYYKPAGQ